MSEYAAIEKLQADHEQRLRSSETALSLLKSQLQQMIANTEDIKERVAYLATGTATQEHINRVEATVVIIQKRLDEFNKDFWRLQAEHSSCLKVKDDTAEAMLDIKNVMTGFKLDMNTLSIAVDGLKRDKDAVSKFFSSRLGALVDRALQFLPWIALWAYLYKTKLG